MRSLILAMLAATLCCFMGAAAALASIPDETGYLTDQTGIIEPAAMAKIQLRLARYHAESHRKIAVLLVPGTPGEELGAYADRVVRRWGLAKVPAGGALLLWSAEGYILIRAMEPLAQNLTADAQSEIISRWIVPAFAEGDPGRGILDGVERMIGVIAGEAVGERPSSPLAEDSAPLSSDTLIVEGGDSESVIILAPAMEMPPWIDALPADLARLGGAVNRNPVAGTRELLREAGGQWGDLPVQVQAFALQMRGEQVEPPVPPLAVNAFYVLGVVLAIAALLLFGHAFNAAGVLIGVAGGGALWTATGFTALALCVLVLGLLSPVLLGVLRAVLRNGGEGDRDPEAVAAAQLKAQLAALASKSRPVASLRPAQFAPSTSATPITVSNPPDSRSSASTLAAAGGPPSRQELQELTLLLVATLRRLLASLRLWHLGLALVLMLSSAALAFLVGVGAFIYFALQRGLVRKFLELAWRGNADLLRQLQKLPAPDPADLKPPGGSSAKPAG